MKVYIFLILAVACNQTFCMTLLCKKKFDETKRTLSEKKLETNEKRNSNERGSIEEAGRSKSEHDKNATVSLMRRSKPHEQLNEIEEGTLEPEFTNQDWD